MLFTLGKCVSSYINTPLKKAHNSGRTTIRNVAKSNLSTLVTPLFHLCVPFEIRLDFLLQKVLDRQPNSLLLSCCMHSSLLERSFVVGPRRYLLGFAISSYFRTGVMSRSLSLGFRFFMQKEHDGGCLATDSLPRCGHAIIE